MIEHERVNTKNIFIFLLLNIIFFLTLTGCGTVNNTALFTKPIIVPEVISYRAWYPNRTVCVLPFDNLSKHEDADIKVREIFVTQLFMAHIFEDIVDLVEANAALMSLRIRKPYPLDKETIKALGERLEADYLILGVVTEFKYGKEKESGSEMGLSVRMIEVSTGNILWTAYNYKMGTNSMGRIFGLSQGPTPMELANDVVNEVVNALEDEIAKQQRINESESGRGRSLFGSRGRSSSSTTESPEYEYRR